MCAIFQLEKADIEEIREICNDVTQKYGAEAADACMGSDVYPQRPAVVVGGTHKVALMRWGFERNSSSKVVFNARSENLAEKQMFRPILKNRCLVPATAFYEFGQDHRKYKIQMPAVPFFYLASLATGKDGGRETLLLYRPDNPAKQPNCSISRPDAGHSTAGRRTEMAG